MPDAGYIALYIAWAFFVQEAYTRFYWRLMEQEAKGRF